MTDAATPSLDLDHVFVMAAADAPEADRLVELGFAEGPPNTHPGQGTANRRFDFEGVMLEFLWICDQQEAQSERTRRTKLWERWEARADPAVSPFGVCAWPHDRAASLEGLGVSAWTYRPSYLPDGWSVLFGGEQLLSEPCWFVIQPPVGVPGVQGPETSRRHPVGVEMLTKLSVRSPVRQWSSCAHAFESQRVLELEPGAPLMTLELDEWRQGRECDFRPALPLVMRW